MQTGPLLAIRADASREGGTGHVMRTLALAQEWISRGGSCLYFSTHLPDALKKRLEDEHCQIQILPDGCASTFSECLAVSPPRWLLIDGYDLARDFQKQLITSKKTQIAVISDHGQDDFHQPDLIIHANIEATADYTDTDCGAKILAGPDYILLRTELQSQHAHSTTPSAKNILVSMGGSDPSESGFFIVNSMIESGLLGGQTRCHILLGPSYPEDGKTHQLSHDAVEIVHPASSMAEHYLWADTVICSPSVTSHEVAHFGTPMAVYLTADNQQQVRDALIAKNAALFLGSAHPTHELQASTLLTLIEDSKKRSSLSKNAATLVDGLGCGRICDEMNLPRLQLRAADENDARILWEWANDPGTRAASFDSKPISWKNHITWLTKQLASKYTIMLIVESIEGTPHGVIRFNIDAETKGETMISISLAPKSRGLGLAPIILSLSAAQFFKAHSSQVITAWIKPENKASYRAFERANYKDYPSPNYPNRVRMRLDYKLL